MVKINLFSYKSFLDMSALVVNIHLSSIRVHIKCNCDVLHLLQSEVSLGGVRIVCIRINILNVVKDYADLVK